MLGCMAEQALRPLGTKRSTQRPSMELLAGTTASSRYVA